VWHSGADGQKSASLSLRQPASVPGREGSFFDPRRLRFYCIERLFHERSLLANIRSDNDVPFASAHALFNLSKLAVWWLPLGIGIERIKPGSPQQNGPHERMHLTLKKEATKPAGRNFLQQQARFDKFIDAFNNERPHEVLEMKCPAEVYQPSPRPYTGLPDIEPLENPFGNAEAGNKDGVHIVPTVPRVPRIGSSRSRQSW
jgi:hypothetical protein